MGQFVALLARSVSGHPIPGKIHFPGSTLADLYDPVSMPPRLAKAHEALDRAVDRCYRKDPFLTDRQRVEYLFALYEQLSAPLTVEKKAKKSRKPKPEAPAVQ